jgi:hypothetical protein
MRLTTLLMLALLGVAPAADAQTGTQTSAPPVAKAFKPGPTVGPPLVFEVSLRRYGPDNFMSASAGDSATTGKLESFVSAPASLCGLSASSTEPTSVPGVGWHVTGEVLSSSAGQMTARVDWQRIWDKGARIQHGPSGSKTITLRAGERVELDRVVPTGQSACNTTDARLEAAVVTKPAYRLGVVTGSFKTAAGENVASDYFTGFAAVRGGRGAATTGAQTGTATTDAKVKPALEWQRAELGYRIAGAASYDAELWLVHRGPDGVETVQQQIVRFSGNSTTYSFPAISVQTSKGPIALDITGKLQSFVGNPPDPSQPNSGMAYAYYFQRKDLTGEKPQPRIMVTIGRRARASGTPLLDITGGTSIAMELPAPTDVLSFELPVLQKAAEDLLKGHQFSLRVRVTPIAR